MPHWSDDAKKAEDREREGSALAEEERRREDRIIRAALPEFWQRLIECLREDADAIQKAFPNDLNCKCRVTVSGATLTVQRMTHPYRTVIATCNADAHRIHLVMSPDLDTMGRPEHCTRQEVYINVLGDDLQLFWDRHQFQTPTDVSRKFFSFLCEKSF